MKVVDLEGRLSEETEVIKERAIDLIKKHNSFVLTVKERSPYSYRWVSCNIVNAELVTIGGLLLHEGAANTIDVTEDNE